MRIKAVRQKNRVLLSLHNGFYKITLTDAEAKELAVELYKMSDGGDGSVTVTGAKKDLEVPMRPPK